MVSIRRKEQVSGGNEVMNMIIVYNMYTCKGYSEFVYINKVQKD